MEEEPEGLAVLLGADSSDDDAEESPAMVEEVYRRVKLGAQPPELRVCLVGQRHSLWGHRLWNAAIHLAELFDMGKIDVAGKTVLELGAGAGLPGLICALNGARRVVITDYAAETDASLVRAIQENINRLQAGTHPQVPPGVLAAAGHVWGKPVDPLLALLQQEASPAVDGGEGEGEALPQRQSPSWSCCCGHSELESTDAQAQAPERDSCPSCRGRRSCCCSGCCGGREGAAAGPAGPSGPPPPPVAPSSSPLPAPPQQAGMTMATAAAASAVSFSGADHAPPVPPPGELKFEVLILADLIFNRSEHRRLLGACRDALARGGTAWVSFSHHDPEKAAADMEFFRLAQGEEFGLVAEQDHCVQMTDLFVEKDGLDDQRGRVYVYRLTHAVP